MKKDWKATVMWRLCEAVIWLRVRYNRWMVRHETRKSDRIYKRSGFGPAFDYLHGANQRLFKWGCRTRQWRSKADRWFMKQFD